MGRPPEAARFSANSVTRSIVSRGKEPTTSAEHKVGTIRNRAKVLW